MAARPSLMHTDRVIIKTAARHCRLGEVCRERWRASAWPSCAWAEAALRAGCRGRHRLGLFGEPGMCRGYLQEVIPARGRGCLSSWAGGAPAMSPMRCASKTAW